MTDPDPLVLATDYAHRPA